MSEIISKIKVKVEAASSSVMSRLKNSVHAGMSGQELLLFFYNYVKFNQVFAGCVTNLSSRFHLYSTHFTFETNDQMFTDIAADIFESAHHEYLHPTSPAGATATHKELSNFFVDNLALILDENKNFWTGKHYFYREYVEMAMGGYGVETSSREANQLYYNIGFHVASEASASEEFEYLATLLSTNYPILKDKLSRTNFKPQDASRINAFTWLEAHGEIEKEHYGSIFRAVGRIFNSERNYDDSEVQKDLISICNGINDFHRMMNLFFTTFENLAFEAKNTK